MENLTYNDIKRYVKIRLDELSNNDNSNLVTSDGAVSDLDSIIEAAILPSVRKIHLEAPNILLRGGEKFCEVDDRTTQDGNAVASIVSAGFANLKKVVLELKTTQADSHETTSTPFLRLVSLKLTKWERPIHTLFGEDSVEYHKQNNKYTIGTEAKPIGFLIHGDASITPEYGKIELYSLSGTPEEPAFNNIQYGYFIPEPERKGSSNLYYVEICPPLRQPCLNQITAEVLRCLSRHQEAAVYDRLAVEPFYIEPDYARRYPPLGERFNTMASQ